MRPLTMVLMALALALAVTGCSGGSTPENTVADCKMLCQRQRDAHCANDVLDRCESRCDGRGDAAGCETKFDALVRCAHTSPIACDSGGLSRATNCASETAAYAACAAGGGTGG